MAAQVVEKKSYRDKRRVFRDREAAGSVLGEMLEPYRGSGASVFAIPAGGVPVAARAAKMLSLPLDVCVVSKITLPWNSEAGYGAVSFDGTVRLNSAMLPHLKMSPGDVEKGIEETKRKVMKRANIFRGPAPFPDLSNLTAILIDDGLASGITMSVAALSLKNAGAQSLVIAVPTGHAESVAQVAAEVDTLYCANIRSGFSFAVADAYEMWTDVTEAEASSILKRFP